MEITSTHNPRLQEIRRALTHGKPTSNGLIVIEGAHLLQEALQSGISVSSVITTAAGRESYADEIRRADCEIIQVPSKTLAAIASTDTAQELLALLKLPEWTWTDLLSDWNALLLVVDAIQDPGNAGALMRSAEAFGATGVVFLTGSVRVSNPKFLRATAGSIFRVPYLDRLEPDLFSQLAGEAGLELFALAPHSGTSIRSVNLRGACALVVGNEGAGISELLRGKSKLVSIPTRGVESLNASIACSLALYEAHNQRTAS